MPQETRENVMAFIGMAVSRDKQGLQKFLGDFILPEDPVKRREVLIGELQKSIQEIKKRQAKLSNDDPSVSSGEDPDQMGAETSVSDLLDYSAELLKELQDSNQDKPIGTTVTEKIIDATIPGAGESEAKVPKGCKLTCDE